MTEPQTRQPTVEIPRAPGLLTVVRHQRKVILVGLVLMVACFWFMGQMGQWRTAALTATGILLAVLNHLASERWLAKLISSGEEPTRGTIAASAFTRLLVLSVVAVGLAVAFWPNGIGLLLGLAIFRLIALVMTGVPLLKELKST